MTRYLIAPYVLQAKGRNQRGAKAKPLADIDGNGTALNTAVESILAAMLQRTDDYKDPLDKNKSFMLSEVRCKTGEAYLLTLEPGRKGLQSRVRQASGNLWTRTVGDTEYVPLRHLIYFPSNGHTALVLAERFGRLGSMTFLKQCLTGVLTSKFPALSFHLNPLTTLAALEAASFTKAIFKAPARRDSSGGLLDFGARVIINVGFKGRRRVKDLLTAGKTIDSSKVFGILTSEGEEAGVKAPSDSKGWEVSLLVEMQNGQPRTFKIDEAGPALVYPLSGATINGRTISTSSYPTTEDFLLVCQSILTDLDGQYDVSASHVIPREAHITAWDSSLSDPWEVTYYD